jgi:replicative DNA helicase
MIDLSSEMTLAGILLVDGTLSPLVGGIVTEEDFQNSAYRAIFAAVTRLYAENKPFDVAAVAKVVKSLISPDELVEVLHLAPTTANVESVASRVRADADRRRIRALLTSAAGSTEEPDTIIGEVMTGLYSIGAGLRRETPKTIREMAVEFWDWAAAGEGGDPDRRDTGYPQLDDILGGMRPGELVIMAARPAVGKQQPIYSKILTPTGYITMGGIRVDDTVIGGDGNPCTVVHIFPQGVKPVYRVTFSDGESADCGIEHLWTVRRSGKNGNGDLPRWQTLTLGKILEQGLLNDRPSRAATGRKPLPKFEIPVIATQGEKKEYAIAPYILGVLIGDGYLVGNSAIFSTPDFDSEIAEKVKMLLPQGYHLRKRKVFSCPQYSIIQDKYMRGAGFLQKINALGLCVKSANKFIPKEYLQGSYTQRIELLRGLMDTDGSSSKDGKVSFSSYSERLTDDVRELVWSLGGTAKKSRYDRGKKGIEHRVIMRLSDCPFSLPRKAARCANRKGFLPRRYIMSAELIGEEVCQCIMVSNDDGLYLTDSHIVTHNSTLGANIALSLARGGMKTAIFSCEMTRLQLMQRFAASDTGMNLSVIVNRKFLAPDLSARIRQSLAKLSNYPLLVYDQPGITISDIRRVLQMERDIGFIVVDYVQLMRSAERYENRNLEVAKISGDLKNIAREFKIPVMALSQLSRVTDESDEPGLSSLRDSGALEQDADKVILLWLVEKNKGLSHKKIGVKVAKNRMGETKTVLMRFFGARMFFEEMTEEYVPKTRKKSGGFKQLPNDTDLPEGW